MLKYSVKSNQPVALIGPPGVGKSAIVGSVAKQLGLPFETIILSLCDPTDIGGFPVTSQDSQRQGRVDRLPLGVIKRACEEPVLLFCDELSMAPPAVQGASMRMIYERFAGDQKLHEGTRIVAALNPPEQAAGGWELALPLIGRMTMIRMRPSLEEIQNYFFDLGEPGTDLRALATDFAATLKVAPELLQIDPPNGAAASGMPWGAPRSWERAIKVCAEIQKDGQEKSAVFNAGLAGNVGSDAAASYLSIRKVRDQLPSIDEILKDPEKAMVPTNTNGCVAVIGVIAQAAAIDAPPAYIYANRLQNEYRLAVLPILGRHRLTEHKNHPMFKKANEAYYSLMDTLGKVYKTANNDPSTKAKSK